LCLPNPPEQVFRFFADADNLGTITPEWLQFEILTPRPIEMGIGTLIDYRIRLYGIPIRWRTRITAWNPPWHFRDEQVKGPYRLWVHDHRFTPHLGGTLMTDQVRYAPRGDSWSTGCLLVVILRGYSLIERRRSGRFSIAAMRAMR
jgi:ligand-binding SRPBCC domain-containing protein